MTWPSSCHYVSRTTITCNAVLLITTALLFVNASAFISTYNTITSYHCSTITATTTITAQKTCARSKLSAVTNKTSWYCSNIQQQTRQNFSSKEENKKNESVVIIVPESSWRRAAFKHRQRVHSLLSPGMISINDPRYVEGRRKRRQGLSSGADSGEVKGERTWSKRQEKQRRKQLYRSRDGSCETDSSDREEHKERKSKTEDKNIRESQQEDNVNNNDTTKQQQNKEQKILWTSLDPLHPIYNFMIEYYGVRGSKGCKRLARWSPDFSLLIERNQNDDFVIMDSTSLSSSSYGKLKEQISAATNSTIASGILLMGATFDDLSETLHIRGATWIDGVGIFYSPGMQFNLQQFHKEESLLHTSQKQQEDQKINNGYRQWCIQKAAPYQWYQSILTATQSSQPILHCNGLHEWAMQYHPPNAPPPPSSKYQRHIPLRVDRQTINAVVERRGIDCTHVDALRFFAPAAGKLNQLGATLERSDQVLNEQKGCVHAHMDLLKIAMRLQPFLCGGLVADCLELAVNARALDVAASPYDCSEKWNIDPVPVERALGRKIFRQRQIELMDQSELVRKRLLDSYKIFLELAFEDAVLDEALCRPGPERFARTEPGGMPWRKNLI